MAMQVEPVVAEAHITDDRAKLGVLRAQLDRFSLKIDGSVQELWNKTNIGGPTIYACSDPTTPASFCGGTFAGLTLPGMLVPASEQQPGAWTGLSNFSANLNYYLFSGFRVEANVKRAKVAHEAAIVQVKQQRKDTALAVARAYWQVRDNFLVLAGVENIGDRQYREHLDLRTGNGVFQPGINFSAGMKVSY